MASHPDYYIERQVLIYPSWLPDRRRVGMFLCSDRPFTLDNQSAILSFFDENPATCPLCPKPHFKIPSHPGSSFTVFLACPHPPQDDPHKTPPELSPNKTIAKILRDASHTCLGNVVVVKHEHTTGISNKDLPIVDLEVGDMDLADEIVRRWVERVYVQSAPAPRAQAAQYVSSLSPAQFAIFLGSVRYLLLLCQDDLVTLTISTLRPTSSRFLPTPHHSNPRALEILSSIAPNTHTLSNDMQLPAPAPAVDQPPQYPLYDLDEIIANLTLEETILPRRPKSRPKSRRNSTIIQPPAPPPPASPVKPKPSPPVTPVTSPRREKLYEYSSPSDSGLTRHWSKAGSTTQGKAGSQVRVLEQVRLPSSKKVAYVVYRGTDVGVKDSWAEVRRATERVRFAIHQGYASRAQAVAAFDRAHGNGWTCASGTWSTAPVDPDSAPRPFDSKSPEASDILSSRTPDDRWYIVYAGIHPGIFPTHVECQLNVLGIQSSLHECVITYAEAQAKFSRASLQGEVFQRRTRRL
ncbi:hypothetical protein C8R43DRAFT_964568 [Mycena crocata]|nr:hypothetical protein C8R43DRAFT_964568 [Mycena crocata]